MKHCGNNAKDRSLGAYWEREFCKMAATTGRSFTPLQLGRETSIQAFAQKNGQWNRYTLPDIAIWSYPGEHHEIKHKNPTRWGTFGLEVYRFNALLWFAKETQQDVFYTIHNHAMSGGRNKKENKIEHWITANILSLNNKWFRTYSGNSYVNGQRKRVPIRYWKTNLWTPLSALWI